jgi:hypothetical protein
VLARRLSLLGAFCGCSADKKLHLSVTVNSVGNDLTEVGKRGFCSVFFFPIRRMHLSWNTCISWNSPVMDVSFGCLSG